MARNSFVFYNDWGIFFQALSMEQRGELVTALLYYSIQGVPMDIDQSLEVVYEFMIHAIARDKAKYEKKCQTYRENRMKGKDSQTGVDDG